MKTQPLLTNFPRTVFATAKRCLQANLEAKRRTLLTASLSGYSLLFDFVLPRDWMRSIDPTLRQRSFGHIPVFWAWLAQILELNSSCSRALGLIQSWYQANELAPPKGDTSGYCSARKRLKLGFLIKISNRINQSLEANTSSVDQWKGFTLKAIDGSSVTLMDTVANQEAYPQHPGMATGCGFPVMGIVGVVNLSHGGWEAFESSGWQKHDARVAPKMLKHFGRGDLMLADRAFCSYELIARATVDRGAHVLMRLHQSRHRHLDWNEGEKVAKNQRIVTWKRPARRPPGSELSETQWRALPETITVRLIKFHKSDRAKKKTEMILVTSLLDEKRYPAEQLASQYMRRWEIEVKLRDVKTTMEMERFEVKSPEMAHKTLWMMMIGYNLIRLIMQRAARKSEKPVHHMSFKGTLDVICSTHESFRAMARRPLKLRAHRENVIKLCAERLLNIREGRSEPRAVKRRPKSHQRLNKPRAVFQEILHREHYRKPA